MFKKLKNTKTRDFLLWEASCFSLPTIHHMTSNIEKRTPNKYNKNIKKNKTRKKDIKCN